MCILTRRSHVACWFVSPLLTAITFYYFAFVDYEPENVSNVFSVVGAVSSSFFISVIFSEVWLISTIVYVPLIAAYMAKLGDGFIAETEDNGELIQRTFFAVFIYAIVTYTAESYSKRAFIGSITEDILFKRWLKLFEAFPEGLAFIRDNQIMFANSSLGELLNLKDQKDMKEDPLFIKLKSSLKKTNVTSTGQVEYSTSVWDFLQKITDKGGPFRL